MNTVPPGVAKGLDLFRLAGDVLGVAVLDVAIGRGDVLACRLVVGEGFDSQGWFRAFGHIRTLSLSCYLDFR